MDDMALVEQVRRETADGDYAAGMRRVVIESPYSGKGTPYEGDIKGNVEYARDCLLDAYERGEAPICSHLLGPQVLDDEDPGDRAAGISAGSLWARLAHCMVVYTDRGISEGMQYAINGAKLQRVPVEYRSLNDGS